ncbi:MAG: hypothetical protein ILNGONEN_02424 [Syntrophorhabdaceae bacterium]|nr:hypothetical protein [Syntrophorhabdaceae bacterium]
MRGPDSVVQAIADGKASAKSIDKFLGGDGIFSKTPREELLALRVSYNEEAYQKEMGREKMPELPLSERYKNFKEVMLGYSVKEAVEEAKRCLHCYVRTEE